MTVVDCFSFHNETDLFKLRLQLLAPVVDRFFVIEACETHSGLPKEPILRSRLRVDGLGLEQSILEKIQLHTIEVFPSGLDNWGRERFQRDLALDLVLASYPDREGTCLLVSDLDELPIPDFIREIKAAPDMARIIPITMWLSYFRPNFVRIRGQDREWSGPFILPLKPTDLGGSLSNIRERVRQRKFFESECAGRYQGWHLSYQGDDVFIKEKRRAFAHQEAAVQERGISVDKLIQSRRGPFDDPTRPPEWAILPISALGMPECLTSEPFIWDRVIRSPDNLGVALFVRDSGIKRRKWFSPRFWEKK